MCNQNPSTTWWIVIMSTGSQKPHTSHALDLTFDIWPCSPKVEPIPPRQTIKIINNVSSKFIITVQWQTQTSHDIVSLHWQIYIKFLCVAFLFWIYCITWWYVSVTTKLYIIKLEWLMRTLIMLSCVIINYIILDWTLFLSVYLVQTVYCVTISFRWYLRCEITADNFTRRYIFTIKYN